MMKDPIYQPKGAAREYGEYALNIYTGCPHGCWYCYAPSVLHKDRSGFHANVEPRPGIVEAVKKQLEKTGMMGKTVHLCFTCDPYPTGYDTKMTRDIIQLLKSTGNHVQILTKGDGSRDFDLLDDADWYGVTITGDEYAIERDRRLESLRDAKEAGIKTWCSFEPVLNPESVLWILTTSCPGYFDRVKIGKLNYHKPPVPINWGEFGMEVEKLCKGAGLDYYIKDSLRKEMEHAGS